MGFSRDKAILALKKTDNNVERAVDWIFSHMDELDQLLKNESAENKKEENLTDGSGSKNYF